MLLLQWVNKNKVKISASIIVLGLFFASLTLFRHLNSLLDDFTYKLALDLEFKLVLISCINFVLAIGVVLFFGSIVWKLITREKIHWFSSFFILLFSVTLLSILLKYYNRDFLNHRNAIVFGMSGLIHQQKHAFRFIYYSPDIISFAFITGISVVLTIGYLYALNKFANERKIENNFYQLEQKTIKELAKVKVNTSQLSFKKYTEENFSENMFAYLSSFFETKTLLVLFKESEYKKIFKKGVTPDRFIF